MSKSDRAIIIASIDALAAEMATTYRLLPKRVQASYLRLALELGRIRRTLV